MVTSSSKNLLPLDHLRLLSTVVVLLLISSLLGVVACPLFLAAATPDKSPEQYSGLLLELAVEEDVDEHVDGAVEDQEEVVDRGHDLGPDGEASEAGLAAGHGLLDHKHLVEVEKDARKMADL